MRLSAFVLTTNSIKNQFPFIESIRSWLTILDELIVVDGGSTDGTIEAIEAIRDNRIKIINNEKTKWPEDWDYSKMGENFNIGLENCTGDVVLKFDADYVLHEDGKMREAIQQGFDQEKMTFSFVRRNFILSDRFFVKSKKTLGINMTKVKEITKDLKYGFDLKKWGWGYEFIIPKKKEHGIWFGDMIRAKQIDWLCPSAVFNYDYMFADKETTKKARFRHYRAHYRQQSYMFDVGDNYNDPKTSWEAYKGQLGKNMKLLQEQLDITDHPVLVQKKIKKMTEDNQGHNCWGWYDTSRYFQNPNTVEYWDGFFKEERFKKRHCWRTKPYDGIAEALEHHKLTLDQKEVWDFGCAFGDGIGFLKKKYETAKFNGIDYSREAIKWASKKVKHAYFVCHDILRFKVKTDVIVLAETLEHLDDDMEFVEKLKGMCKMLIISVPYKEDPRKLHDLHVHSYGAGSFLGSKIYRKNNYLIAIYEN